MACRLVDDSGNTYDYVELARWKPDGTAFALDDDGRPLIGPSGPRVDPDDLHKDHVQHVAAAKKLGLRADEYEGQRAAGLKWCWYKKHWVPARAYSRHPLSRICKRCGRHYERQKSKKRRARRRHELILGPISTLMPGGVGPQSEEHMEEAKEAKQAKDRKASTAPTRSFATQLAAVIGEVGEVLEKYPATIQEKVVEFFGTASED